MPRSPNSAEDSSKARQTPYVLGLIFVILAAGIGTVQNGKAGTPESLLKQADDAMYAAKEAGRNRVCLAPSEKAVSPPA